MLFRSDSIFVYVSLLSIIFMSKFIFLVILTSLDVVISKFERSRDLLLMNELSLLFTISRFVFY